MNQAEQFRDTYQKQLGDKAARLALEFRRQGFHCSESVFSAINTTLNITDPQMVRLVTGFHGGGGSRRKHPEVDLTDVLNKAAAGLDQRPLEEIPIEVTGHLCGAIASGIVCLGLLFGRRRPTDDLTCVDELSFELHRRFERKFGVKLCRELREKYVPLSPNRTCEYVYQEGSRLAVELIVESARLVDRCPKGMDWPRPD